MGWERKIRREGPLRAIYEGRQETTGPSAILILETTSCSSGTSNGTSYSWPVFRRKEQTTA